VNIIALKKSPGCHVFARRNGRGKLAVYRIDGFREVNRSSGFCPQVSEAVVLCPIIGAPVRFLAWPSHVIRFCAADERLAWVTKQEANRRTCVA